jgi:hypothetical protein
MQTDKYSTLCTNRRTCGNLKSQSGSLLHVVLHCSPTQQDHVQHLLIALEYPTTNKVGLPIHNHLSRGNTLVYLGNDGDPHFRWHYRFPCVGSAGAHHAQVAQAPAHHSRSILVPSTTNLIILSLLDVSFPDASPGDYPSFLSLVAAPKLNLSPARWYSRYSVRVCVCVCVCRAAAFYRRAMHEMNGMTTRQQRR